MADKKEIYADGIGQIHFAGAMVRFDFANAFRDAMDIVATKKSSVNQIYSKLKKMVNSILITIQHQLITMKSHLIKILFSLMLLKSIQKTKN